MKPLLYALALLAALLALCLGAASFLGDQSAETQALLQKSYDAAETGDLAGAEALARRALGRWEAHMPLIDALTSHEETDEVRRTFAELLSRAETGQREEFLAVCARLTVMTGHLGQMERPKWYNLLSAPAAWRQGSGPLPLFGIRDGGGPSELEKTACGGIICRKRGNTDPGGA